MNSFDALYAITHMSWYEVLHDPETLALFKQCRGFRFPLLACFKQDPELWNIELPLPSSQPLPDDLLVYMFGPSVLRWKDTLDADWIHYIRASIAALQHRKICSCCEHTIARFQPLHSQSKRQKLHK